MIGTIKTLLPKMLSMIEDKKIYILKEYKEQRNKKQNSKYWKLLGQLAIKLNLGVEELHFQMLKDYSQRYQVCIPADQKIRGIDYYEKKSTFIRNNVLFNVYIVYVPSHELNTYEFALLLNGLCEECRQQEIETLSPNELLELESIIKNHQM